ncbi:hypothetical protein B0H10DRAFT_639489 [Mycena sp. CBHHK59/15]|nr:hypothetical protein B0H10DRAFT_639489 [Mycena sp. CBHHK59/15]
MYTIIIGFATLCFWINSWTHGKVGTRAGTPRPQHFYTPNLIANKPNRSSCPLSALQHQPHMMPPYSRVTQEPTTTPPVSMHVRASTRQSPK